jgi:transposase InsO family protein
VADITYIRTLRGLFLFGRRHRPLFPPGYRLGDAEPPDHGRRIAGSAYGRVATQAEGKVLIHSDQGSQFDAATAMIMRWPGASFNLLKRERIRRKVYRSRDEARQDVLDHIEMFYNPRVSKKLGAIQRRASGFGYTIFI